MVATKQVDIPARIDWDLWEWIDEFFRDRTGWGTRGVAFTASYSATWPGGSVSSRSVKDLRRDAEGESIIHVGISYKVVDGEPLGVGWSLSYYEPSQLMATELTVQGRTREEVAGLAEVVGREVAKAGSGQPLSELAGHKPVEVEKPIPASQQRSGRLMRLATDPNPWLLIIGGTLIAGVILGLLTNWFGLGG